jgi:hypothetical protein
VLLSVKHRIVGPKPNPGRAASAAGTLSEDRPDWRHAPSRVALYPVRTPARFCKTNHGGHRPSAQDLDDDGVPIAKAKPVLPKAEQLVLDKDTQGVAGMPIIADVVFEKIAPCAVFVPDLGRVANVHKQPRLYVAKDSNDDSK